ncbi:hypothetical protein ACYX34_08270 [Nitrospira sp. CMX1]|nr:hypothetical protein [Nitrospira sp.]MBS0164888.1 hypothetical protein [Nitrospira sp.]
MDDEGGALGDYRFFDLEAQGFIRIQLTTPPDFAVHLTHQGHQCAAVKNAATDSESSLCPSVLYQDHAP